MYYSVEIIPASAVVMFHSGKFNFKLYEIEETDSGENKRLIKHGIEPHATEEEADKAGWRYYEKVYLPQLIERAGL